MKSVIQIDEVWTVDSFRNSQENAEDILNRNELPNLSAAMENLIIQQQVGLEEKTAGFISVYDEQEQIGEVRNNLDDYDKAYALAMLTPDDWGKYKITGEIAGYLQVPELLVTERESVDEAKRYEIMNTGNISLIRELLAPSSELDISPAGEARGVISTDWFWKPTGEVMFGIEGQEPIEIPCWPENVKDSTSASWSQEMTTYQHYEPKNTYKGSGPRTVSCTFKIHRAMWDGNQDSGFAETLFAYMQSACYPDYDTQAAEPPRCLLLIGKSIRIKGIMTVCDQTFEGPIGPDTKYDCVSISISITEESDNVLSTSAVRGGLANWR